MAAVVGNLPSIFVPQHKRISKNVAKWRSAPSPLLVRMPRSRTASIVPFLVSFVP
jgi:hypothetical protein